MSVFRVEKNKNYTVISNYHLRDKNLSLKTIGLLSLILSLPDTWDYTQAGLAAIVKDGEDSVRSGLKELEKFGYLERKRERDENGRMKGVIYHIYEAPKSSQDNSSSNIYDADTQKATDVVINNDPQIDYPILENPTLVNPMLENQLLEFPTLEQHSQINKDKYNTYKSIKDKTNNQSIKLREEYRKLIFDNINMDLFVLKTTNAEKSFEDGLIDCEKYESIVVEYNFRSVKRIVEYMLDVITSLNSEPIKIGNELISREVVKQKLLTVDFLIMKQAVFALGTTLIKNPKSYIISMLYNS